MSFERRPAALVEHVGRLDPARPVRIDDDEIGEVALAQVTAFADAEYVGRRMAGTVDEQLVADAATSRKIEQHLHGMLHERQSGGRLEVRVVLLVRCVRGMVGRDDVDAPIVERSEQRLAILGPLDCRIALDARAEFIVARLVEPQVMHTHLGRDAFLRAMRGGEQAHLDRGRQVQHVQQGVVLAGEVRRQRRRLQAGIRRADRRVLGHRHVVAVFLSCRCLIVPDRGRVFAVGDDHHRGMFEDLLERLSIVDEHVTGRRAHEDLDAAGLANLKRLDLLDIGIGRAEIETVVRGTAFLCPAVLRGEFLARHRQRIDVRHIHEARDAAGDRGRRLGRQVALVSQPWLAKMHLVVDHARHQVAAGGIDDVDTPCSIYAARDLFDALAADQDIRIADFSLVDHARVTDQDFVHGGDYATWQPELHAHRSIVSGTWISNCDLSRGPASGPRVSARMRGPGSTRSQGTTRRKPSLRAASECAITALCRRQRNNRAKRTTCNASATLPSTTWPWCLRWSWPATCQSGFAIASG